MPYDPTNPSVAGLEAARRSSAFFRTLPVRGPGPEGLLLEALSSALRPGSAVIRRPVVDTLLGPTPALFAIVTPGRRVAIVQAPTDAPEPQAALLLVYGTFDAVYLVDAADLESDSPRVASAIARAEPRLFTSGGRSALAVCALATGAGRAGRLTAGDRRPMALRAKPRPAVRALRLNRPAEWSDAFDAALAMARTPWARSA